MIKRKPYTKKDFTWAQWTSKDIRGICDLILKNKIESYKEIKKISASERTFENTVYALESSDYGFADMYSQLELLKNVSPDKKLRKTISENVKKLNKKLVDIEYDEGLYVALKEYSIKKEKLAGDSKKLLTDMLLEYRRMGFDLPKSKQFRLKANLKKMTDYSAAFETNLNNYEDHILVTKEELYGLPDTYVSSLSKSGSKYKVSLQYPDLVPFMSGAHDEKKREELALKNWQKGGKQNVILLNKLIKLRHENTKLLGYKTYVDFKTEVRTAKSGKNVENFLTSLISKIQKKAENDMLLLENRKKKDFGKGNATIKYFDLAYYVKQTKKDLYNVDQDEIKQYFPFQKVKQGTLETYSRLLGVKFKQVTDIKLWHKDVELFQVFDKNGQFLSYFLLDLYPRKGKYGHAAAFDVICGREVDGIYTPPMACIVTNFPKTTKANPSLMGHGEVNTFFHEFGHVMHFVLTKSRYASQAGFHVAWDFVEAPSQMFENWVWDEKVLKNISSHFKTRKPLSTKLISALKKSRIHFEGASTIRQLVLALFDYTLHTKKIADPNKLYSQLAKKHLGVLPPQNHIYTAGFAHIVSGYDAGYYGYMWSRVFAADMFSRFETEGVLNAKVGMDYKKWILEKGSSEKELKLVEKFLKRKPNNKAFLKSLGIKR